MAVERMRSAPRGTKRDWVPISAKVPPAHAEWLTEIESRRGIRRTDTVAEAVAQYLASYGYQPTQAA